MQRLARMPGWAVWALGLLPLAWLIFDALTGGLGAEPVREIQLRLGLTAIWFLIGGLAITPLRRLTRINLVIHRRRIGLLATLYAVLHVVAWAGLDLRDLSRAGAEIARRPWLMLGMGALLLILPLAATSSNLAIRILGPVRWRRLHRLVYPAAIMAAAHFLALGKTWTGPAILSAMAVAVLLALRLPIFGRARL
ncbi:sulfite oxidase heme-binding subunit YedZ [Paracoccus sp. p4-l81]|uniref:sulfite oxidase heme-binding subunit YedZ n=1 Tax=unclassified Paracoccus (in: a-proteobacteria) TaxID=2688777 RepID=UPI0035BA390E